MPQRKYTALKPYEIKPLKIKVSRHPDQRFYVMRYRGLNNRTFSTNEIKKFAQIKSNELKKLNPNSAFFSVTVGFKNGLYRNGGRTIPGQDIKLFDQNDYDIDLGDITSFDIFFSVV